MKNIYLLLHRMNFDTALGAAITSLFIAKIIDSEVPQLAIAALFLAVLAIYNFDHLLDAKRISGEAISARHRFYQQYFTPLTIYQFVLLIALLVISCFLPVAIIKAGIIMTVITLIYFLLLFIITPERFVFKEVMIATVFSAGLFLAPLSVQSSQVVTFDIILLWIEIFLLAIGNTLIFSWYDYTNDLKEGHSSLAQIVGPKKTKTLSYIVLALLLIIILLSLASNAFLIDQIIILLMGAVLYACLLIGRKFNHNESVRIAGEAIFLIPLVRLMF